MGTEGWQELRFFFTLFYFFGSGRPQKLPNHVTQMKHRYPYRMITAPTPGWRNLMLGVDEARLNHFPTATVRCVITDCEVEADLMTRQDEICEKKSPSKQLEGVIKSAQSRSH